jgi:hypothetical protein
MGRGIWEATLRTAHLQVTSVQEFGASPKGDMATVFVTDQNMAKVGLFIPTAMQEAFLVKLYSACASAAMQRQEKVSPGVTNSLSLEGVELGADQTGKFHIQLALRGGMNLSVAASKSDIERLAKAASELLHHFEQGGTDAVN